MKTYIIRFNHPEKGSASAEIIAATAYDALEDFRKTFPDVDITSSYEKQLKVTPTFDERNS